MKYRKYKKIMNNNEKNRVKTKGLLQKGTRNSIDT